MPATLNEILNSDLTHRPVVMGVLNVTPDSFSDGGEFFSPQAAAARCEEIAAAGADAIDVGAESTRPGAERVSAGKQIDRLRDVIPAAVQTGLVVSVDTTLAPVARFALDAGAQIINDVSAGRDDPDILGLAAERNAPIVLMHMKGTPATMQDQPHYDDVCGEVIAFLAERVVAAEEAGVPRDHCIVDPGIGFGKRLAHNLALMAGVGRLVELGHPVLIGPSRKRFIAELTDQQRPTDRVGGTIAACFTCWRRGVTIFRVHDVWAVSSALTVARAIEQAGGGALPV